MGGDQADGCGEGVGGVAFVRVGYSRGRRACVGVPPEEEREEREGRGIGA